MSRVVKGAKAGQQKARQPVIAKDTAASLSTLKILYGLSEGEIVGLVDGAKSISLDGTQVMNDNNTPNFVDDKGNIGVVWDMRNGTNDQTHVAGFPLIENETQVTRELKAGIPFTKTFTEPQLSAVRVRLFWDALKKQETNGDVKGVKVKYAIDLQTDSGAFVTVLNAEVNDKTSGKYERAHRIDLPEGKKWTIRVRRITPDSTSDLVSDKMYVDAVTEVIDAKLRYPNTAVLGVQYNAKTFSNVAKLAARCRGRIIRVAANYDPVNRTYSGLWDGTFKLAYTNNPAWVFLDLCTHWRYGLGSRIDLSMIDKWSIYQLAQYCDQMVDDGKGGLEPRFTVNVYIQAQQDAFTVLQSLSSIFRAMSYWRGEQIIVDADMPSDPVYTFTQANVVEGKFEYTGTRARDRHTVAKVAWDNPDNKFKTEYEPVRDEAAIAKHGVRVLDLSLMGCTSKGQAQRAGLWALKSERLETRTVSFRTGLEGFLPNVGDIITVADEIFAGRAIGGRVVSVTNQTTLTLDRPSRVAVGDTLVVNTTSGVSQQRIVSAVSGTTVTVSAAFDKVEAPCVWAVNSPDLKTMLFRVLSIHQEDGVFQISALQHEPQKFDAIDFGARITESPFTVNNPVTVSAPENITITQYDRTVQAQNVTTMVISWSQVKEATGYLVEWRKNDGNWIKMPVTGTSSIEVEGVYSGTYSARVKSVNAFEQQSQWATSSLTDIKGKLGVVQPLAKLTATGILFGMRLNWGFSTNSADTNYIEIQSASAPNTNVALLGQFSYPTDSTEINGLQGGLTQYYRGRVVDKLGNFSTWTNWVSGVTDASADKVLDLLNGEISESQLNTSLGSKITQISTIDAKLSQEVVDRTNAVTKEVNDRVAAVKTATDAITKEVTDRTAAVKVATDAIDKEVADRAAAVSAEAAKRKTDLDAVNTALSKEVQDRLTAETGIKASITSETTARTDADSAMSSKIDAVTATAENNKSLIVSEQTTRADADKALSGRIDTLVTTTNNNTAAITTEQKARTDADTAITSTVNALTTRVGTTEGKIVNLEKVTTTTDASVSELSTGLSNLSVKVNQKADSSAVTSLDSRVTNAENNLNSQSSNLTSLNNTLTTTTNTANAKGKVLYGTTAPATADQLAQNLWIDTTNGANTPKRWNGSSWVTVTDKVASDALAAATTANTTLTTKADASALNSLDSKVTSIDGRVTSNASNITSLTSRVSTAEGNINKKLDATAINSYYTKTETDSAISSATTQVTAAYTAELTIKDTRNDNQPPSWYWANYPKRTVVEFKSGSSIGSPLGYTGYGNLTTVVQWSDSSGGSIQQTFSSGDSLTTATRYSTSASAWSAWKSDIKNLSTQKADASALTALDSKVTTIDGKVTAQASQLSNIDTAYKQADANLTSRVSTLETSTSNNTQTIATTQTQLNARFDALSVGGRNLLIQSRLQAGYLSDSTGQPSSGAPDHYDPTYYPCVAGEKFTGKVIDFNGVTSLGSTGRICFYDSNKVNLANYPIVTNTVGAVKTVTAPSNTAYYRVATIAKGIKDKIERGNTPTDWTPAPEDIDQKFTDTNAAISNESSARASADSALSQNINTLQTTVNGNTASIQTQQTSLNGLSAQYTVKVDVNGRVAGFGLASTAINGTPTSEFAVRADKFYIAAPNGTDKGTSPFTVLTAATTINGVSVPAGTYIQSAYIQNGSIDSAKIANATITSAKIGAGEIKTVNIDDAAITSAKIGTAEVDTLNIRGQAVTVTSAITQTTFFDAKTSANTDAIYLYTDGVTVAVEFSLISCNPEGSGSFLVECYVNDVVKGSWNLSGTFGYYPSMFFPFSVATGTEQTKVHIKVTSNGAKIGSQGYFFKVTGLKR